MTAILDRSASAAHVPARGGPPPRLGYQPALDGVRGLAVALVVLVHVTYVLVPELAGRWLPGGFVGVDVFFVLSGFLITTLLLEEHHASGRLSVRSFYARRALRLVPAVALLLLAHGVLTAWAHADLRTEARSAGAVALYSANWVVAGGGSLAAGLGHLWSLSVEGQFYLVLPAFLAVALVSRRPTALIVGVASAGILWATGLRAWLWMRGAGWETIYVRTDARVDELLMGVLLAVAFRHGWRLPHRWRYAGPAALALLLLFAGTVRRDSGWLYAGGGFTLVGLTAVLLVGATLDPAAGLATVFAWRPAVRLGRASYSLYLWHVPVFAAVTSRLAGRAASERLVVGLGGCALATLVSYRLVEMPLARVRRKLASERAPDRRESSRRQSPRQVLREQPVPSCRPTVPTTCLPLARSATPP